MKFKQINEIRLKLIDELTYEANFYNPDGQKAQSSVKIKANEISSLDTLRKINRRIKRADIDENQGRLL